VTRTLARRAVTGPASPLRQDRRRPL